MIEQKNKFISLCFQFLGNENYVLLKHIHDTLAEIEENSDIDILLFDKKKTLPLILAFVKNASLVQKYEVQQQSNMTQFFVYFNDNSFLQIDCLYQLIRKNVIYLSKDYIFENKRFLNDNTATYSHKCLLEHLVLFNFLNYAGVPQKYIDFFNALNFSEQQSLLAFFNKKYQTSIKSFEVFVEYDKIIYSQLIDIVAKIDANNILFKIKHTLQYLKDTLNNLINNRGKIISFSGVDGAGKSTLLAETSDIISEKYRRKVVILRHRPSILPILSSFRYGKKRGRTKSC